MCITRVSNHVVFMPVSMDRYILSLLALPPLTLPIHRLCHRQLKDLTSKGGHPIRAEGNYCHTFELVDLPPSKKPVGCKSVFKNEYKPDGSIQNKRVRLVAQGFLHQEGVDYGETFEHRI